MKREKLGVVRGSGNVFRDLGFKNADAEQFKAILAAEIIKELDRKGLSVRAAHGRTGIAAADFSRIRNADLGRFTVDRLMSIINRLGSRIEVKIRVRRGETVSHEAMAYPPPAIEAEPIQGDARIADFCTRRYARHRQPGGWSRQVPGPGRSGLNPEEAENQERPV
jgi:predicted XRE-type DNA-binding protein